MCRLFAFRSNTAGKVHHALVSEANSLRVQSNEHKDGWGIAYYDNGLPQVARGIGPAHQDAEFERVSQLVSSQAVLAHVRLASVGEVSLKNAHPFQFSTWMFAHNGTLAQFGQKKQAVEALIHPEFRECIQGDTDSERCFYVFLSFLRQKPGGLENPHSQTVSEALAQTMREVSAACDPGAEEASSLNFIVTNGAILAASRRNRPLFFSEWKKKKDTQHIDPSQGMALRQLIVSSEKLSSADHWHDIAQNEIISVDEELVFSRMRLA